MSRVDGYLIYDNATLQSRETVQFYLLLFFFFFCFDFWKVFYIFICFWKFVSEHWKNLTEILKKIRMEIKTFSHTCVIVCRVALGYFLFAPHLLLPYSVRFRFRLSDARLPSQAHKATTKALDYDSQSNCRRCVTLPVK